MNCIEEELQEQNEEALTCDGLEEALIGVCYRFGQSPLAAYSVDKILNIHMTRDKMTYEEAV